MKRRFLLAVLSFAIATGSFGAADPVRNAKWWSLLNSYQRQAYVTGVFDGITVELLMMAYDDLSARVAQNQRVTIQNLLGKTTSDEIIRRLERFYRDRKNQAVLVGDAIVLVALEGNPKAREMKAMFNEALEDARKRGARGW